MSATVQAGQKRKAPCIVFIDEIDAVGTRQREEPKHGRER